jgi:hypothetical protein
MHLPQALLLAQPLTSERFIVELCPPPRLPDLDRRRNLPLAARPVILTDPHFLRWSASEAEGYKFEPCRGYSFCSGMREGNNRQPRRNRD